MYLHSCNYLNINYTIFKFFFALYLYYWIIKVFTFTFIFYLILFYVIINVYFL